jgi:hypothetical protein
MNLGGETRSGVRLPRIGVIAISILGASRRRAAMQHRFSELALQHTMLRRTKVLAPTSIQVVLSHCFALAVWLGDNLRLVNISSPQGRS